MSGQIFKLPTSCVPWLAVACLLVSGTADAALGGNFASVQAEAQRLNGSIHTIAMPAYDLHEIQLSSGIVERQYMNHAGQVFGISWKSKGMIDVQAMLGSYFPKYQTLGAKRIDLHHSVLSSPDLVVEVGGFLHTFTGRAYLPAQLPAGMAVSEIH